MIYWWMLKSGELRYGDKAPKRGNKPYLSEEVIRHQDPQIMTHTLIRYPDIKIESMTTCNGYDRGIRLRNKIKGMLSEGDIR